mgnify:CR=1 FL=1
MRLSRVAWIVVGCFPSSLVIASAKDDQNQRNIDQGGLGIGMRVRAKRERTQDDVGIALHGLCL